MLDTGPAQAWNVGSVRPVALVTGFSRPASPSAPSTVRFTARLIALRTGQLVGRPLGQVRLKAFVPPAASQ